MRIATWNINSVAVRIDRVCAWLESAAPDVLCLQELKVAADDFPLAAVEAVGYQVAAHGDGRWNGVAILSRVGVADVVRDLPGQPGVRRGGGAAGHRRDLRPRCGVWSLYVAQRPRRPPTRTTPTSSRGSTRCAPPPPRS